ncbi:GntR family transcriptional regulator [Catenuloplanes japonicus]|uniref:GntR family transcriptional regulator n=1 Tax=Catenuloplanes japonicus TaxID=33876 RepID=UPI0005260E4F|nr:UTRA domain-containing protein [Catenuloplanes japonicus]
MSSREWTSDSVVYLTPDQGDAWAAQARAESRTGSQRILDAGEIAAPDDVAAALALTPGSPVVRRRRLILADDEPVEIASSFYPLGVAVGTGLAQPSKIRGGAVTLLAELGFHAEDVREDVAARHPADDEAELLAVLTTAPVLVLSRLSLTASGVPFEYSVMVMGAGQHLRYRMAP